MGSSLDTAASTEQDSMLHLPCILAQEMGRGGGGLVMGCGSMYAGTVIAYETSIVAHK